MIGNTSSGPGVMSTKRVAPFEAWDAPPGPGRFRRRTKCVSAEQFFPDQKPWPTDVSKGDRVPWHVVTTLSGPIRIDPGDWIITHDDGLRFRVAADLFPKMYEPVEAEEK